MSKKYCNQIELRCDGIRRRADACNNLLGKYTLPHKGEIEIKCNKCGTFNILRDGERVNAARKILDEYSSGKILK